MEEQQTLQPAISVEKKLDSYKKVKKTKKQVAPLLSICIISSQQDKKNLERVLKYIPLKKRKIELIFVETGIALIAFSGIKEQTNLLTYAVFQHKANEFSFSEARNYAKSLASGSWILSLDMDEFISEIYWDMLFDLLIKYKDVQTIKAIRIGFNYSVPNFETNTYDRGHTQLVRIIKNLPELQWEGIIHEALEWRLREPEILNSSISVTHLGYDISKKALLNKHIRNIKLLGRALNIETDEKKFMHALNYMDETIKGYKELLTKN